MDPSFSFRISRSFIREAMPTIPAAPTAMATGMLKDTAARPATEAPAVARPTFCATLRGTSHADLGAGAEEALRVVLGWGVTNSILSIMAEY